MDDQIRQNTQVAALPWNRWQDWFGIHNQTEIGYRLAWARTYLKKAGYLENSSRGVWALTEKAKKADTIDSREIVNYVRSLSRPTKSEDTSPEDPTTAVDDLPEETQAWRERLHC